MFRVVLASKFFNRAQQIGDCTRYKNALTTYRNVIRERPKIR